jgi:hypothetical protein
MCWMTVLLAMYLKAGWVDSAPSTLTDVASIRDLRMFCYWVSADER